ncbi:MAG: hypothetical protein HY925_01625 [Elusimicrobia bacterium]|nr:hypothetical protein [Elusimicrobiota bacterium]
MLRRASLLLFLLASAARAVPVVPDELADIAPLSADLKPRRTREPAPVSPWYVAFGRDWRGSSASINYQLRWDFDDVRRSPAFLLGRLRNPIGTADLTLRGVAEETRFDLYGLHVKPFRGLFVEPLPLAATGPSVAVGPAAPAGPTPRRRRWYDVDPYLEEIERSARRDARRFLIKTAFDSTLPTARGAPQWQKEAATKGLLDLGRSWESDLPY